MSGTAALLATGLADAVGAGLEGVCSGDPQAHTEWIFVAPCDISDPAGRLVELLLVQRHGVDAVVPQTPSGYDRCSPPITATACLTG